MNDGREGRRDPDTTQKAISKAIAIDGTHACRDDHKKMCLATGLMPNGLLFVTNRYFPECPYHTPFGYSGICNFSARKEIYQKYKL